MTKEQIKQKEAQLLELTKSFCTEKLDDNYTALCEKLIRKMGRKRQVPFQTGRLEIWAAAIIHALGSINFLFDKSFTPYCTSADINDFFGTKQSTVGQKSLLIRDMFDMTYYDGNFSTNRMEEENPFNNLVMVDDLIVPLTNLSPEVQRMVKDARAQGRDIELKTR